MEFLKWQFKLRRTLHLLALCNFLSTFSLQRRRGGGTGKLFSFLSSCPPTPPLPLRYRPRAPLPLQHRSPSATPPSLPSRPHSPAVSQSDVICTTAVVHGSAASHLFMEPSTDAFCISRVKPANAETKCGAGEDGVVVRLSHT